MKRLVYAPKAFVFIRSSNMGGRIYDVSEDVVSGSVQRLVNEPSTASLVLRNKHYKYIRDKATGKSIFLPMDLVTIWLQRIAGKPIQVFTGYLDSVPYMQLYPGNCEITAKCTLKRLAFSWFDPGLEFFHNWVQSITGWVNNPATGTAVNPFALVEGKPPEGDAADQKVNDGSFGRLLYEFMVYIAGWPARDVIVSDIDPDLPKKAVNMWSDIQQATNSDIRALEEMMRNMMGVSIEQDPDGVNVDGTLPEQTKKVTKAIIDNASSVPPLVLVAAAHFLSGFRPGYSYGPGDDTFGYGLYRMRPTLHAVPRTPGAQANMDGQAYDTTIDGVEIKEILNAAISTKLFAKRMNRALYRVAVPASAQQGISTAKNSRFMESFKQRAANGDVNAIMRWIEEASGVPMTEGITQIAVSNAKRYLTALRNPNAAAAMPATTAKTVATKVPKHLTWDSPELLALLDENEKSILNKNYRGKGALEEILPYIWLAKKTSKKLKLNYHSKQRESSLYITYSTDTDRWHELGPIAKFYEVFVGKKDGPISVSLHINNGGTKQDIKRYIYKGERGGQGQPNLLKDSIRIVVEKGAQPPDWVDLPTETDVAPDTSADKSGIPDGLTFEQFTTLSANAAFAARFAFPASYIESHLLTGNKSLMNDVSCLDAVKQFCQASMRNFMSLPDGRFLAFYPDYFSAKRKPYWAIYDIEIVNMGIQLNDESLATHVYVVGDSIFTGSGDIDLFDRIHSRGVATLAQAGILESFIEELNINPNFKKSNNLGRLADAEAFLQHYGARPYKEDAPIIRNGAFEFLLAFQRFMQLWSSQFATHVEFTFQPEVMAGGVVWFPQHGLQMYVDSVTHTFDYSSGFSTQAQLSAPAVANVAGAREKFAHKYPGFALAGGINSVGV